MSVCPERYWKREVVPDLAVPTIKKSGHLLMRVSYSRSTSRNRGQPVDVGGISLAEWGNT